jgi:hypothetical protein
MVVGAECLFEAAQLVQLNASREFIEWPVPDNDIGIDGEYRSDGLPDQPVVPRVSHDEYLLDLGKIRGKRRSRGLPADRVLSGIAEVLVPDVEMWIGGVVRPS